jgi:CBS-domain-containing membrane protein
MLSRVLEIWCGLHRSAVLGCLWMAVLLGALSFLDLREGRIFLIPPFAATLTMLVYQPGVAIAQPVVVVCGSVFGTMIGTVLALLLGFGPEVATLAALTSALVLPLLRVLHPPGIALAMCPALLHLGSWFTVEVVLPFTLVAVISSALLSRLLSGWPRYPVPLSSEVGPSRRKTRARRSASLRDDLRK